MNAVNSIIFALECIAVISFSVSGTVVAIGKRADVFGAVIFSFITTFGGGLIRDLIIGNHPPLLFVSREYAILAAICFAVSLTVFLISFAGNIADRLSQNLHNLLLEGTDMLGLALFCILGVDSAMASAPEIQNNVALLVFCGCITGVGGGILRDVFSAQIPLLFRKHVYIIPALLGTACYVLLLPHTERLIAILVSVSIILILRTLAIRFHWNLPTPLENNRK